MVKEKTEVGIDLAKQNALEQENIILRQKIADMEAKEATPSIPAIDALSNEIRKIRQKSGGSATTIKVYERNDHKNISLWTRWGKRIGPMHPDNAIQALTRFADIGIMLTADQPTVEQKEAYSKTPEYKKMMRDWQKNRDEKDKSRKTGQLEKLAQEIAKMSGTTVEAINHILRPSEVGKKA